jgi:hypothetical protein
LPPELLEDSSLPLAELREFVKRVGPSAAKQVLGELNGLPVRMSQARIVAIDWTGRQLTLREFGDPADKTNVAWNSWAAIPRLDEVVWLMKWGNDSIVIGHSSGIMYSTPYAGRTPAAQVRHGTPPGVVANFVWQKYVFDFQAYDTDDMVTLSGVPAETDHLSLKTPGLWHFEARIMFGDATTVPVMRGLRIGAPDNSFWYDEDSKVYDNTTNIVNEQALKCGGDFWISSSSLPVSICMWVAQGGGGALTVLDRGIAGPRLSATWLGPEP